MPEFHFAVSPPVSTATATKRDRIARKVGGPRWGFVSLNAPGNRVSYGFGPNRGAPFDAQTAREIEAAWTKAGV